MITDTAGGEWYAFKMAAGPISSCGERRIRGLYAPSVVNAYVVAALAIGLSVLGGQWSVQWRIPRRLLTLRVLANYDLFLFWVRLDI